MCGRMIKANTRNVIGSYCKWIAAGMILTFTGCSLASAAPSPSSSETNSEPASSLITFQLQEATIAQMQDAMKSGALSSVELTAMYLNRVYAYDSSGIRLNSIPVLNPDVLKEAAQADQLRAQGIKTGPLQGIPYTVKDSYKVKGLTVASGSPAFKNLMAKDDAFTVEKIRKTGGVLIGKTNMPPMAAGECKEGFMAVLKVRTIQIIWLQPGTLAPLTDLASQQPPTSLPSVWGKKRYLLEDHQHLTMV